jgi:hypothetical protein
MVIIKHISKINCLAFSILLAYISNYIAKIKNCQEKYLMLAKNMDIEKSVIRPFKLKFL